MPTDQNPFSQFTDNQGTTQNTNIVVNGKTYNKPSELPPEAKQKLEEALAKIKQNPGLFKMLGGLTSLVGTGNIPDLAKLINAANGTTIENTSSTTTSSTKSALPNPNNSTAEIQTSIHTASPQNYTRFNQQRAATPTFNPAVKGDGLRKAIFVIIAIGLICYLIYRYGFLDKFPL